MNDQHSSRHYYLKSAQTSSIFEDTNWILEPRNEEVPALLRSVYHKNCLELNTNETGLFQYSDWLPVHHTLAGSAAPVTYKSRGLAGMLGLKNLFITFNGYWPEKQAWMKTCTFKETEAYSVCARLGNFKDHTLVVASAGNTARAFARVCSDNKIPLLVFVPERNLHTMWFNKPVSDVIKLVAVSGGDYLDAIHLSQTVCDQDRFLPEGGVKNIARRDGMGVTVLSAVTRIGRIPEYYFQAIGSGSGAIAAWEANLRMINDGRYGSRKMKIIVSQNKPFTPIYHAWKAGSRQLIMNKIEEEKKYIPDLYASVLSNRLPAYSIAGGLYDVLKDSSGDVVAVDNDEAEEASGIFFDTEGIDIHPAAAVATASLISHVKKGLISKDAEIMLNITGGGEQLMKQQNHIFHLKPDLTVDRETAPQELKKLLADQL